MPSGFVAIFLLQACGFDRQGNGLEEKAARLRLQDNGFGRGQGARYRLVAEIVPYGKFSVCASLHRYGNQLVHQLPWANHVRLKTIVPQKLAILEAPQDTRL
ncbi:hypothetical protein BLA27_07000 [Brucella cytisi]|uniref:Uncharacterized protein n=1 Tax=Brucella cytisi TaxID=407152 RepID=A0A1J6HMU7_9HYPH|nr:hypothetical protein BLA27_07000 [Brucella cytisi]